MKKIFAVIALSAAAVFADNASAEWNVVEAANKVQAKADETTAKINEAKAKQEAKDAEAKAKREAKAEEAKAKLEAKQAEMKKKYEAKQAEKDAKAAKQKKAVEDAKDSMNNLKKSLTFD